MHRYTVLDCPGQGTFINADFAQKLRADSMKPTIKIKLLKGESIQIFKAISRLKVSKSIKKEFVLISQWHTKKKDLPVGHEDVVATNKMKESKYLEELLMKLTRQNILAMKFGL